MPIKSHQSIWRGKAKVCWILFYGSKWYFVPTLHWIFGIAQCLCMFWEGMRQKEKVWNAVSTLPSFLVFPFASYKIYSQRNLQAIKYIWAQAVFARNWTKYSAGAHLPSWSVAPFHGSTCRNLLLLFYLPVKVSTVLRLILQLRAIKRSDPDSSPALDWSLNTLSRELWYLHVPQQM